MNKRLISIGLSVTLLFSVTGCGVVGTGSDDIINSMVESRQTEKERVIEEAQAYLEESYPNDVFTYYTGKSPDWAYRYYELTFTSEKYDNQYVTVYGNPQKDDNPNSVVTSYYRDENGDVIYDYYDTYYEYAMKDEAEEYFYNIAKKYISDDFVLKVEFFTSLGFATIIRSDSSFVDNYKSNDVVIMLYIYTNNDTDENQNGIDSILQQIADDGNEIKLTYEIAYDLSDVLNNSISNINDNLYKYCSKRKYYTIFDGKIKDYNE